MSTTPAGKANSVAELDAADQVLHARFLASDAEASFEWPDHKERSGKSGKADVKRRRKNRDARNLASIDALETAAAKKRRLDDVAEHEDEGESKEEVSDIDVEGASSDPEKPKRHRITKNALAVKTVLKQLHASSGKLEFPLASVLGALEQLPLWATRKGLRRCDGLRGDECDLREACDDLAGAWMEGFTWRGERVVVHFDPSEKLYPCSKGPHNCSSCSGRPVAFYHYDARTGEATCMQCRHTQGHAQKADTCSGCSHMLDAEQNERHRQGLRDHGRWRWSRLSGDCFCGSYKSHHECVPAPLIAAWEIAHRGRPKDATVEWDREHGVRIRRNCARCSAIVWYEVGSMEAGMACSAVRCKRCDGQPHGKTVVYFQARGYSYESQTSFSRTPLPLPPPASVPAHTLPSAPAPAFVQTTLGDCGCMPYVRCTCSVGTGDCVTSLGDGRAEAQDGTGRIVGNARTPEEQEMWLARAPASWRARLTGQ